MKRQDFSLKPFPGGGPLPSLTITGNITRHSHHLAIRYELRGDLTELMIPAAADAAGPEARAVGSDLFRVFPGGQG